MSRWASAHLSELERRDEWIPIRHHFGVRAVGINAFKGDSTGDQLITEHREDWRLHEELYVVLEGHATFRIDGEEVDAPARTIVYVREPSAKRSAVAKEADTVVLAVGGEPGAAFVPSDYELTWPYSDPAFKHYRAGRYSEAAQTLREGLAEFPDSAGLRYNLACFSALAGDRETALAELAEAIRREPRFRESARSDDDFASLRDDPGFNELLD
ncbi:MAG TPA: tetratricopeptide repeat protein [Gaiellaceae bacterium]